MDSEVPETEPVPSLLLPCTSCNRTFRPEALAKHAKVCEKILMKKRKQFDSAKQRLQGTEIETFATQVPKSAKKKETQINLSKTKWKEKAELTRALQAIKKPAEMPKVKPSDFEECLYCGRSFGPKAFERHTEFCKEQHQKLKLINNNNSEARERLKVRTTYRGPLTNKVLNRDRYQPNRNRDPSPLNLSRSDYSDESNKSRGLNRNSSLRLSLRSKPETTPPPPLRRTVTQINPPTRSVRSKELSESDVLHQKKSNSKPKMISKEKESTEKRMKPWQTNTSFLPQVTPAYSQKPLKKSPMKLNVNTFSDGITVVSYGTGGNDNSKMLNLELTACGKQKSTHQGTPKSRQRKNLDRNFGGPRNFKSRNEKISGAMVKPQELRNLNSRAIRKHKVETLKNEAYSIEFEPGDKCHEDDYKGSLKKSPVSFWNRLPGQFETINPLCELWENTGLLKDTVTGQINNNDFHDKISRGKEKFVEREIKVGKLGKAVLSSRTPHGSGSVSSQGSSSCPLTWRERVLQKINKPYKKMIMEKLDANVHNNPLEKKLPSVTDTKRHKILFESSTNCNLIPDLLTGKSLIETADNTYINEATDRCIETDNHYFNYHYQSIIFDDMSAKSENQINNSSTIDNSSATKGIIVNKEDVFFSGFFNDSSSLFKGSNSNGEIDVTKTTPNASENDNIACFLFEDYFGNDCNITQEDSMANSELEPNPYFDEENKIESTVFQEMDKDWQQHQVLLLHHENNEIMTDVNDGGNNSFNTSSVTIIKHGIEIEEGDYSNRDCTETFQEKPFAHSTEIKNFNRSPISSPVLDLTSDYSVNNVITDFHSCTKESNSIPSESFTVGSNKHSLNTNLEKGNDSNCSQIKKESKAATLCFSETGSNEVRHTVNMDFILTDYRENQENSFPNKLNVTSNLNTLNAKSGDKFDKHLSLSSNILHFEVDSKGIFNNGLENHRHSVVLNDVQSLNDDEQCNHLVKDQARNEQDELNPLSRKTLIEGKDCDNILSLILPNGIEPNQEIKEFDSFKSLHSASRNADSNSLTLSSDLNIDTTQKNSVTVFTSSNPKAMMLQNEVNNSTNEETAEVKKRNVETDFQKQYFKENNEEDSLQSNYLPTFTTNNYKTLLHPNDNDSNFNITDQHLKKNTLQNTPNYKVFDKENTKNCVTLFSGNCAHALSPFDEINSFDTAAKDNSFIELSQHMTENKEDLYTCNSKLSPHENDEQKYCLFRSTPNNINRSISIPYENRSENITETDKHIKENNTEQLANIVETKFSFNQNEKVNGLNIMTSNTLPLPNKDANSSDERDHHLKEMKDHSLNIVSSTLFSEDGDQANSRYIAQSFPPPNEEENLTFENDTSKVMNYDVNINKEGTCPNILKNDYFSESHKLDISSDKGDSVFDVTSDFGLDTSKQDIDDSIIDMPKGNSFSEHNPNHVSEKSILSNEKGKADNSPMFCYNILFAKLDSLLEMSKEINYSASTSYLDIQDDSLENGVSSDNSVKMNNNNIDIEERELEIFNCDKLQENKNENNCAEIEDKMEKVVNQEFSDETIGDANYSQSECQDLKQNYVEKIECYNDNLGNDLDVTCEANTTPVEDTGYCDAYKANTCPNSSSSYPNIDDSKKGKFVLGLKKNDLSKVKNEILANQEDLVQEKAVNPSYVTDEEMVKDFETIVDNGSVENESIKPEQNSDEDYLNDYCQFVRFFESINGCNDDVYYKNSSNSCCDEMSTVEKEEEEDTSQASSTLNASQNENAKSNLSCSSTQSSRPLNAESSPHDSSLKHDNNHLPLNRSQNKTCTLLSLNSLNINKAENKSKTKTRHGLEEKYYSYLQKRYGNFGSISQSYKDFVNVEKDYSDSDSSTDWNLTESESESETFEEKHSSVVTHSKKTIHSNYYEEVEYTQKSNEFQTIKTSVHQLPSVCSETVKEKKFSLPTINPNNTSQLRRNVSEECETVIKKEKKWQKHVKLPSITKLAGDSWSFPFVVRHVITNVLPKRFSIEEAEKYNPYLTAERQMLELLGGDDNKEKTILPEIHHPSPIQSSPTSAFVKYSSPKRASSVESLKSDNKENNNVNSELIDFPPVEEKIDNRKNFSLSNLSLCSVVSLDSIDYNKNSLHSKLSQSHLDEFQRSFSAIEPKGNRSHGKSKVNLQQMLYGTASDSSNDQFAPNDSLSNDISNLEACEAELLHSMLEFEKMLSSSPHPSLETSPTLCSSSSSHHPEEDSDIKDQKNLNNSIDSAYSSLTRSGGGEDPGKQETSKFCHECGAKYPIVGAKFCCICGMRRITL